MLTMISMSEATFVFVYILSVSSLIASVICCFKSFEIEHSVLSGMLKTTFVCSSLKSPYIFYTKVNILSGLLDYERTSVKTHYIV